MHVPPESDPVSHRTYTPEEQEAILAMAMKIQHEAANDRTLQDLERTASEVGIEPYYIREAARRLTPTSTGALALQNSGVDQIATIRALVTALVFLPAEAMVARILIQRTSIPQNAFLLGILLVAVVALAMPRGKHWRYAVPALSITAVVGTLLYFRFVGPYGGYNLYSPTEVTVFVVVQFAVALCIHSLADRSLAESPRD